ncbi:MAG: TonB-dependent receptor [Acidobacteriia bacterium]|nr:TonB-dependent receptor [Terriglobia bacterium]
MDVNPSLAQQYQISALYFQDAWKVRKRLTLSLGLRWTHDIPTTERFDRSVRGFDSDAVSPIAAAAEAKYAKSPSPQLSPADFHVRGGLLFAGVGGQPRSLWRSDWLNFAPRIGLAWMAGSKMVGRAGYGVFYDPARRNAIQTGFSRQTTLVASQDTGQTYIASLEDPFPKGFNMPTGSSLGLMTNAGQSVTVIPGQALNPYMQHWEAILQKAAGGTAAFEIGYVGTRGVHLRAQRQLDPVPLERLSRSLVRDNTQYAILTTNVANPFYPLLPSTSLSGSTVQLQQLLRPYPQFTGVTATANDGFSWYHGLQALAQRRFRNGFALASYTWSKYMEATSFLNEADPAPARSISPSDRAHRLVAAGLYELPFGRSRKGFRWSLARGWQVQAIYQRQSGAPLSFGNVLYYGGQVGLPADRRSPERWFNTAVFERATANQLVYNVRFFPLRLADVRSMGLNLLDLGMSRKLRAGERATVELRADAFNVLNHTRFAAPNTSPTSTDFGAVTATSQLPRNLEFTLRLQF